MDQKYFFKFLLIILGTYWISIQIVSSEISTSDGKNVVTKEEDPVAIDRNSYKLPVFKGDLHIKCCDDAANFTINTNQTHPYFIPKFDTGKILKIVVLNGTMHTLTSDMCDTFEKIIKFKVINNGLKMVHANAFHGCKKLKNVILKGNKLTTLPKNLFVNHTKLLYLNLINNTLANLDGHLFEQTPGLRALLLDQNQLQKFPFDNMPVLVNLTEVSLDNNPLRDLDTKKVLELFPKLRFFSITENNFGEEKSKQICKELKNNQTKFDCWIV